MALLTMAAGRRKHAVRPIFLHLGGFVRSVHPSSNALETPTETSNLSPRPVPKEATQLDAGADQDLENLIEHWIAVAESLSWPSRRPKRSGSIATAMPRRIQRERRAANRVVNFAARLLAASDERAPATALPPRLSSEPASRRRTRRPQLRRSGS